MCQEKSVDTVRGEGSPSSSLRITTYNLTTQFHGIRPIVFTHSAVISANGLEEENPKSPRLR